MGRRKKKDGGHENNERWLVTYSDLITLLMIFFIIMYTMASVDKKKFKQLASSLHSAIASKGGAGDNLILDQSGNTMIPLVNNGTGEAQKQMQKVEADLKKKLEEKDASGGIKVFTDERGLVIRISSKVLFMSGSAEILADARPELKTIAAALNTLPNQIRIEGYTDSQPIHTSQFPSNWELSGARAFNVLKFIMYAGYVSPKRLAGIGYGEYRPLNPNNKNPNRPDDRRVDIVVVLAEQPKPQTTSPQTIQPISTNQQEVTAHKE